MAMLLFALMLALAAAANARENPDAILQRSVEALRHDFEASPNFDCLERDRILGETRTYEDTMILGSPYQRLVAINGKPLTPAQAAEEQHKFDSVVAERKAESPQQRAVRIVKYEKEQKRDHSMMNEMVKAFNFTLLGETTMDGHQVYFLKASPRPGYQPPNMEAQALTGMQGKLWIDKKTFQWVRVEAQVVRPVSIEGFLAQVEPGTRFELEKTEVAPGVWLPAHFSMRSRAKVLFLFTKNDQEDDTYFNYHRRTPDRDPRHAP